MSFEQIFERFLKQRPISVMARACLQYALSACALDELFNKTAQRQYTRELLFSTVVNLMSLVVCRKQPSVHAAYQRLQEEIGVSVTSLYNKLDQLEPGVSGALIPYSAQKLGPVLEELPGKLPPLLPGYRVKILDGNHLAATQHRLKALRQLRAAPLPGQAVVVLDPEYMLAVDTVLCEDGQAQERSMTEQILARVQPGEVWVGDRNFCTAPILFGIDQKPAYFIIRHHQQNPSWRPLSTRYKVKRIKTGVLYEQAVELSHEDKRTLRARRTTLVLDKPTRDGDTEIHILTNLPQEQVGAQKVARLYSERWTIEMRHP